jgi:hypothetical protein
MYVHNCAHATCVYSCVGMWCVCASCCVQVRLYMHACMRINVCPHPSLTPSPSPPPSLSPPSPSVPPPSLSHSFTVSLFPSLPASTSLCPTTHGRMTVLTPTGNTAYTSRLYPNGVRAISHLSGQSSPPSIILLLKPSLPLEIYANASTSELMKSGFESTPLQAPAIAVCIHIIEPSTLQQTRPCGGVSCSPSWRESESSYKKCTTLSHMVFWSVPCVTQFRQCPSVVTDEEPAVQRDGHLSASKILKGQKASGRQGVCATFPEGGRTQFATPQGYFTEE